MTPTGQLMKPEDWDAGFGRSIGMFLNGNGIRGMDTRGQRVVDDSFLLLFNAHDEPMDWVLPPEEFAPAWRLVIDTSGVPDLPETIAGGSSVQVAEQGHGRAAGPGPGAGTVATTHAAADVPTIAPVPVPMRAESGASLSDESVPPAESREPNEALVTEVPSRGRVPRSRRRPDSSSATRTAGPRTGAGEAGARPRRPKKK